MVRRLAAAPPGHHADYDEATTSALPFAGGLLPERLVELVQRAGWPTLQLRRLTGVEWVAGRQLPWPERLLAPSRCARCGQVEPTVRLPDC